MTKDDIIRMAIESELVPDALWETPELERFATLVALHEREACAALCERIWPSEKRSGHEWSDGFADGAIDCADAIRARSQS